MSGGILEGRKRIQRGVELGISKVIRSRGKKGKLIFVVVCWRFKRRNGAAQSSIILVGDDHFQACLLWISHSFSLVCFSSLFLLILGCCSLIGSRH